MTMRLRLLVITAVLLATGTAGPRALGQGQTAARPAAAAQAPFDVTAITLKLDVDIPDKLALGKWAEAEKTCTEIIDKAKLQPDTPEIRRILIRAYEARGRARLNLKDKLEISHEDFYAILSLEPDHKLVGTVSESEAEEFRKVKDATQGHIALSMLPAGTALLERVDGQTFSISLNLDAEPKPIDLVAGSYKVTAKTATGSYDQLDDTFTVTVGPEVVARVLKLVRRTSTLSIVSIPAGAEVVLDDVSRGQTKAGDGSTAKSVIADLEPASAATAAVQKAPKSAVLAIDDLMPAAHTLQLRLRCFKPIDQKFTIVRQGDPKGDMFLPGDLTPDSFRELLPGGIEQGAFKLTPATATVKMQAADSGGALFLDGDKRAGVPADAVTICEGPHTIEVRGPRGRFLDTRQWKATDTEEKLDVQLRDAFAISNLAPGQGLTDVQKKALDAVKGGRALVYIPYEKELAEAAKEPGLAPDFWSSNPSDSISKEGKLVRWRQLADKLQAQGLAAITSDATNPAIIRISLLAPGSSVASVVAINTEDPTSRTQAGETLGAPLPQFWRRSVGISVVDADHVHGAVIVRVNEGSAGARAGLKAGSTIVRAGGTTIESVADWDAALKKTAPGADLQIDVKGPDQSAVKVTVAVAPEALPFLPNSTSLRGSPLPANVALVDLLDATVRPASAPTDAAIVQAASINLAIVHKQLGNWQAALDALGKIDVAQLGDGAGVSAGTVAYLKGLCLEKLDRDADAQTEFKKAAAARSARLDVEGPLVWPLAQVKIHPAR
jgi:hypothetical protein